MKSLFHASHPLAVALTLVLSAGAQDAAAPANAAKVASPTRAARLTFVSGAVQIMRSDNSAEDTPVVNMPIVEGTRITTSDYGQAEIEFEDGSVVRITPRSALVLQKLAVDGSTAKTDLNLLGGLAYFELRKSAAASYRVEAAGASAMPTENLVLRVNLDDPPPVFAVLSGAARVEHAEAFHADVRAGESLRTDATDDARYFLSHGVAEESWDQWNLARDQAAGDDAEKRTVARNGYAGNQGYGWSDLDANGRWYDSPGMGQVWQPDGADDAFDPYGYGAWTWSGQGYVWASGYSWGWTPFRCGRWNWYAGFGWAWAPDSACGGWGSGGGVNIGSGPPHHQPILRPVGYPGRPHPIIPVHGANGLRPPVVVGRPINVAGKMVQPLQPIGQGFHAASPVGQALMRDFPIERGTREPVIGTARAADASTVYIDSSSRQAGPVRGGNTPAGRPVVANPAPPANLQPATVAAPVMTRQANAAPAPVHSQPPPAPAPVHMAPPPPPASAPTPAHTEPAKTIPKL